MKQLSMKKKISIALVFVIMLAGLIVVLAKGFRVDSKYSSAKQMEVYLEQEFQISDVKAITDEVLGKKVTIQKVELYEDMVSITASDITDEQKDTIVEKLKEKYTFEETSDEVTVKEVPSMHIRELFKPYVVPVLVATVIILVYVAIRFMKIGALKSLVQTELIIVIAQILLFSLIAITRIPVGRFTIPMMLFVYVLSVVGINIKLEKCLKQKKLADEKKKASKK